ncbi:MAG: ABC-type transport auxiliary lipoprotein family protein [Betaproteobacteria bacterium]
MTVRTLRVAMNVAPRLAARLALAAAAVALVAGCSLSRPAPVKAMFLLEPAAPPAAAKAQPATLRVGTVNVAAPFRGRAFVYRESELRYQSDFYAEFVVAPAAMIGELTARGLDGARVFVRVLPPGAPPDGDYVLDGFVSSLYGDGRDAGKPAAEVAVTYYLSRADIGNATPFWSKEYRRRVAVAGAAPEGYAAALSTAMGEILAELAKDLAAVSLPKK